MVDATPAFTINNAAVPFQMTTIATGSDYNSRLGRKIIVKSILIRFEIRPETPLDYVNHTGTRFRFALFVDRQSNSTACALADVFGLVGNTITSQTPTNLNNRDRFRILVDRNYFYPPAFTSSGETHGEAGFTCNPIIKVFKRVNIPIVYASSAAVIPVTNAIYFVMWSDYTGATSKNLTIYPGTYRVRFVDA